MARRNLSATMQPHADVLHRHPLDGAAAAASCDELAASRQVAALFHVVPLLAADEYRIRRAAARATAALVAAADVDDLVWLDGRIRAIGYLCGASYTWSESSARDLTAMMPTSAERTACLGMLSCHRSGYVRERAVQELAADGSPEALPFLVLRCNDWVEPVRRLAVRAVEERRTADDALAFVACLPLVLRLRQCSRTDHGPLVEAVERLLSRTDLPPAIIEAGLHARGRTRRHAFALAVTARPHETWTLYGRALGTDDPALRRWAGRAVAAAAACPERLRLLTVMLAAHDADTRSEALYRIATENLPGAVDALQAALLDPGASVRHTARHHLPRFAEVDVPAVYREALAAAHHRIRAVAATGLGESGSAADADSLVPLVDDPYPSVARRAVTAIGALDAFGRRDVLQRALADGRAGVSRAARLACRATPACCSSGDLRAIVTSSPHEHCRRNAVGLLAVLDRWSSLPIILECLSLPLSEALHAQAHRELARWRTQYNRSASRPTAHQLDQAARALAAAAPRLSTAERANVAQILESWRR